MNNLRSRESVKFFGSPVEHENAELLLRTKTDIDNSISKILKLVKNKNRSAEDGSPKHSRKETQLVGLIEDLHNQHQSLYALYDRVTEEFGKVISRRRNKRTSDSSSDSDSEYFSSEEVDGNKRRSEKEHYNVSHYNTPKHEPYTTELEEQLTLLVKEMENLNQKKGNLELEVESQTHEVKQLSAKNTVLHDQIMDLELKLKEENGVVSDLQAKLINNENQAKSNVANFMQKLDFVENQNKELEAQMERKGEETSQLVVQIENLNENLAETRSVEENMKEEKERFLARMKDLELELEARSTEKNELEEKLSNTSYEIKQLIDENKTLQDRNRELRTSLTKKGEEISSFLREHENNKNGASMEALALKAKVNAMRLELDTLQEQKNKLEQQNERSQKEHAESLAKMETLNANLSDQEKTIERMCEENKQAKTISSKLMSNQRLAERKMEELAEKFRKKMEDNIRLLHQRLHVAEQVNNENKNSCKMTKQRYEEENKVLGEKVATYEEELRALKEDADPTPSQVTLYFPNEFELVGLIELDLKVEEHKEYVMTRVSKMMREVDFAKDWVNKRNGEVRELKDNVDNLKDSLNKKEEQEVLLREKVWNLEAKVSKEGGEKLNLTKAVSQLEKKVAKLEKNMKEKDEELVSLGEKKREAIRQLCILVDFHRDRCNYLKDVVTKSRRVKNKT
ncbi:COP1-interactive protein 1-like [Abrus precatorius]|uniref:COP1-interactive protein 1-like n=1 Tax=Abrus precatorius TaxID=3816 RepID=A0A8B8KK05_ABRPR|nr:COP1-interactive protein 1-like [Abrus precatorius]